jgi:hypothetical protein
MTYPLNLNYHYCLDLLEKPEDLEIAKKFLNSRKRLPIFSTLSKTKSVFYNCKYIDDLKKKILN